MQCFKVKHATERLAEIKLEQIKSAPNDSKKPTRVYYCIKCDCWHLTSMIKREFYEKIIAVIAKSQQIRDQRFIYKEAEFWEQKLKVDKEVDERTKRRQLKPPKGIKRVRR